MPQAAKPPFAKILIANRGEIACRIMNSARRMGIATVAVHSQADAQAMHVEMADEAVCIGPAAAALSYLDAEKIIEAALKTGAQAIHPGYGFLSENADFAESCAAAGLVFIGPNPRAMRMMGDKIRSKTCALQAGVSVVPGHVGEIADAEEAVKIAREIGYPVMIKASAGGGGKGMRIARSDAQVREGFQSARSEARSAFGDERIFIEKYIDNPRHVEIQVMGDKHGNIIHLGERECSIQRRNQKVVEEAPSPLLDAQTRQAMGEQACALARAVGYDSAGTVEFVAGQDRSFHFLEMNTRLQVEHPVTEMVTGVDLVEMMIRAAAGEPLGLAQEEVKIRGWAVETRIYAEDPWRNFMPSIGRIRRFLAPPEEAGRLRVDSGVGEGGEISMHYDPMIAKLVTWGKDRKAAIAAQQAALDGFCIEGIAHNIPFLAAIMANRRWREGRLSTGFIEEEFPGGFAGAPLNEEMVERLSLMAAAMDHVENLRRRQISGQLPGNDVNFSAERVVWREDARTGLALHVECESAKLIRMRPDKGGEHVVEPRWRPGQPLWHGRIDGVPLSAHVRRILNGYELTHHGARLALRVYSPFEAQMARLMPVREAADTARLVISPMPGKVLSVAVKAGQAVKAGDVLCVVEAMKMENILRAERDGVLEAVHVAPGDAIGADALLMEFGT